VNTAPAPATAASRSAICSSLIVSCALIAAPYLARGSLRGRALAESD
jgi:hypothetical protein